jgi:hypothetical protein
MARYPTRFSISQLESMLNSRRDQLAALAKERAQLEKQLGALDLKIRTLGGSRGSGASIDATASGRARNEKSLIATMEEVLTKAGKPMGVGDILEAVQASGYRSTSANFRGIINQTLILQRKRFTNAGRGLYAMKK